MKQCKKCGGEFSWQIRVNGKPKSLSSRKYCLVCSPYKNINSRSLIFKLKPKKLCVYCAKPCKTRKNTYCSNVCQNVYQRMRKLKSGKIDVRSLKRIVIQNLGQKCSICNLEKWLHYKIPLILDHINGDSLDNSIENLRLVCGNCDMFLPTYKGRNKGKGKGRAYRRERYAKGLSY